MSIQAAFDAGEAGIEEDLAFHREIADVCGNPHFRQMSDYLEAKSEVLRLRSQLRRVEETPERLAGSTVPSASCGKSE